MIHYDNHTDNNEYCSLDFQLLSYLTIINTWIQCYIFQKNYRALHDSIEKKQDICTVLGEDLEH